MSNGGGRNTGIHQRRGGKHLVRNWGVGRKGLRKEKQPQLGTDRSGILRLRKRSLEHRRETERGPQGRGQNTERRPRQQAMYLTSGKQD